MYTIYGIPNCDSVKKAMKYLKLHEVEFAFHNFKKDGIDKVLLENWCKQVGWEKLVNKKGTTWRGLAAGEQDKIVNEGAAIDLMSSHSSIIKRPVIMKNKKVIAVGFDEGTLDTVKW